MTKFILLVFGATVISFSGIASAQQATITPQNITDQQTSDYYQNPAQNEQNKTYDVGGNVVGGKDLQNTTVPNLTVTGAPAESDTVNQKSTLGWLAVSVIFLLVLMSPALLMVWDTRKKKPAKDPAAPQTSGKNAVIQDNNDLPVDDTTAEEQAEQDQAKIDQQVAATQQEQAKMPKSKKKKPANKQKRGKKKRK